MILAKGVLLGTGYTRDKHIDHLQTSTVKKSCGTFPLEIISSFDQGSLLGECSTNTETHLVTEAAKAKRQVTRAQQLLAAWFPTLVPLFTHTQRITQCTQLDTIASNYLCLLIFTKKLTS